MQRTCLEAWKSRVCVWVAVIVASRLPEIIGRELGFGLNGLMSPFWETLVLLALAVGSTRISRDRNLPGFIVATIALTFTWRVVVPWIETSSAFIDLTNRVSWGARFFLLRATRLIGAFFLIGTLLGSGIGCRELYLRFGNWNAPVQPEPFFFWRRQISWRLFGLILLLLFALLLPIYLYFTLDPQIGRLYRLLSLAPWALATSALNAASEEFQFRSVMLGRLSTVIPLKEAYFVVAVFFGVGHYFGQPSGWGGIFMAGFAGWVWAKSMVETRGFGWAFATHFAQDMIIFFFLAVSKTDLSSAWS